MVLINIQFQLGTQGIRKGFSVRFAHIVFVVIREFLISECTCRFRCGAHDRGGCARVKECVELAERFWRTENRRPKSEARRKAEARNPRGAASDVEVLRKVDRKSTRLN